MPINYQENVLFPTVIPSSITCYEIRVGSIGIFFYAYCELDIIHLLSTNKSIPDENTDDLLCMYW